MASVREALDKISELESRRAILETLLVYLETHYRSSDAGAPDMVVTREDLGSVPEEHIDAQVDRFVVDVDAIKKELDEWKNLSILPPGDDEDIAKKARRGRRKRGTQSKRVAETSTRQR